MKTRNGFVSNSSSSSFVVLLPPDFKFNDLLPISNKKLNEMFEYYDGDSELNDDGSERDKPEELTREQKLEILSKLVKQFMKNGYMDGYDQSSEDVQLLNELFHDYTVAAIEGGPDGGGSIVLADRKVVNKILKIKE